MIEVVKPVIEWQNEGGSMRAVTHGDGEYDEWAASISEGWCPPDHPDGKQHQLKPYINASGEQWLRCPHGALFRLVYPNEIEQD